MFRKIRRYITIFRVFSKYNLFSLIYSEVNQYYVSNRRNPCVLDSKNRDNAVKLRKALEELGPTFIKLGQILSKRPDIVPAIYIEELGNLQDNVNPLGFDTMKVAFEGFSCSIGTEEINETLEHSNFDIHEIFDEFNTEPIACASIAQVYEAKLDGKKVAVKITRPNLINTINLDLAILSDLKPLIVKMLGLGKNFDIDGFLYEFSELLSRELDLSNEARNIRRFEENFADVKEVHVPHIYDDFSNENVLVMDYMEGVTIRKLSDVSAEKKKWYADIISKSYLKQVYIDGFYHADPHSSNIILQEDGIAYIDFGAVGTIDDELRRNMLNLFYGIYKKRLDVVFESFMKITGINKEDINVRRFKLDLDDIISKQNYSSGERQSDNYATLGLKYDLSLPTEFSTLERALILIEANCLELDPRFNLLENAKPVIMKVLMKRYSPFEAFEYLQLEGDRYLEIIKELPQGVNDVIETIRGYKIERFEKKTDEIRKYKTIDSISKYTFLLGILLASSYFAISGEGYLPVMGIVGFMSAIFLFAVMFVKDS
ncbi:putative unusual protein kinase [Methanolobus tindarius DSM 2278]|jgi:ubiquinone biosynthesis protein|uniref:Putative unusual protein kinase n=1 Tax=Methanolobus tindarius DSM 2278 TaxID=1090322 RepID=W9DRU0_METTI|nr:lipopolysaccharide core heptose(II) kinase RfaY [Methanolobus tindarius]ETA68305.1 putative unusual protein kinase [Methanolobus tindarius DSM 2278]